MRKEHAIQRLGNHRPIRDDLCQRYELAALDSRYLDGAVRHFEFMTALGAGARLRAALAAWRCDPAWAAYHARVGARALRRRWRGELR